MANTLKELEHSLRPISIGNRISALLFKSPSSSEVCEVFNQWLSRFLSCDPSVVCISEYEMTLEDRNGQKVRFWVANYPYSYGCVRTNVSFHPHEGKMPNWRNILTLRAIHLSQRKLLIDKYKKDILEVR